MDTEHRTTDPNLILKEL
jgi:hypothetical protein